MICGARYGGPGYGGPDWHCCNVARGAAPVQCVTLKLLFCSGGTPFLRQHRSGSLLPPSGVQYVHVQQLESARHSASHCCIAMYQWFADSLAGECQSVTL